MKINRTFAENKPNVRTNARGHAHDYITSKESLTFRHIGL